MAVPHTILPIRFPIATAFVRGATTVAATADFDPEWSTAKRFSEIPGPKALPIPKFGNVWRLMPFGPWAGKNMLEVHEILYKEYGDIVKISGVGRADMIMLYDPKDIEKMHRNESISPNRPALESIGYYKSVTRFDVSNGHAGLLNSQGEAWSKNRSLVNQPMMNPRHVKSYHTPIQEVATEFVERIRRIRDAKQEVDKTFLLELNKFALEIVGIVCLDTKLGCFDPSLTPESEAHRMIYSARVVFDLVTELDYQPTLWPYISTRKWRKYVRNWNNITEATLKYIDRKIDEIKNRTEGGRERPSLLEILLKSEGGKGIAVATSLDMIIAGIDTVTQTTANVMYHLAKSPHCQELVFQEVLKILPNQQDSLPEDYESSIPYLKACIKESQRVAPVLGIAARTMVKDVVLHGYQIPKGTDIGISNWTLSHMEKHYPQPKEYIPERWLKSEKDSPLSASQTHPFVLLPFGFGPRMCIGRRFAELQMHSSLAKIIRNFKISYNYGEMKWKAGFLVDCHKPLQFQFIERK